MNVFELRDRAVGDYASYVRGFLTIKDPGVAKVVDEALEAGALWPEPWVSLNPSFERGGQVEELVERGLLHPECGRIFRLKSPADPVGQGMSLYHHQVEAIEAAGTGDSYVVTTRTGSGKSLTHLMPIVDSVLRNRQDRGPDQRHRLSHERPCQQPGRGAAQVPLPRLPRRGRAGARRSRRASKVPEATATTECWHGSWARGSWRRPARSRGTRPPGWSRCPSPCRPTGGRRPPPS